MDHLLQAVRKWAGVDVVMAGRQAVRKWAGVDVVMAGDFRQLPQAKPLDTIPNLLESKQNTVKVRQSDYSGIYRAFNKVSIRANTDQQHQTCNTSQLFF